MYIYIYLIYESNARERVSLPMQDCSRPHPPTLSVHFSCFMPCPCRVYISSHKNTLARSAKLTWNYDFATIFFCLVCARYTFTFFPSTYILFFLQFFFFVCMLHIIQRWKIYFFIFLFFVYSFLPFFVFITIQACHRKSWRSVCFYLIPLLSLSFMVARKTAQIHIFLSIPMLASTRRGSITCSTASFYILFFPIHIPLIFLLICFASFCFVLFCLHFIFLHCVCNVQIQGDTCGYAYVRRPM